MQHPEPMFNAKVRAGLLACLPGVGLGVASAILALTFPEEYGVIDFRVWKVIFNEDRRQFVMSDYTRYLERIRDCAHRVGWQAQQVDFFSWKYYETLPA